jgi:hypothetical protein
LRFRDRERAELPVDHLLKTERTQTIVKRPFDPIHLLLRNAEPSTPALISTALEYLPAILADLLHWLSQHSTPGCALTPFRYGSVACVISVTRSASSAMMPWPPRPVMTTCCVGLTPARHPEADWTDVLPRASPWQSVADSQNADAYRGREHCPS